MNLKKEIIFIVLELISGIGIGLLGTYLISPELLKFNMDLSILVGIISVLIFALIGIWIPGFFHSKMKNSKLLIGILNSVIFLTVGLFIGGFLSLITNDFLPTRTADFAFVILIPILIGVIGFNIGLKTYANNV